MASNTQQYTTIITLNDQEAKKTLEQLQKRVDTLNEAREKAIANKEEAKTIKEISKELKSAQTELKSYEQNVSKTISVLKNLGSASSAEIKKTMQALKREQQQTSDPTSYAKLEEQIDACRTRLSELQHNQELVNHTMNNLSGASLKDLEQTAKMLNTRLKETKQGTKEYEKLTEQLKQVKTQMKEIGDETKESESAWSQFTGFLNDNWGAITEITAAATGLTLTVREAVQRFADMEEAMANVRKYTGQTSEEVHDMNEEFKSLDTRSTREELNELAGVAGRLGKTGRQDIMDFVDAADKIGVALGDDLGDGAVDKIGKLAMAFGEDEKKGLRGAMLATGSAINELAQNSSAQAGYLVEFTARVAGVAKTLGMSQADIMGFGAVLDETMQKDEMAATAFSQLLSKMASDTTKFAGLAGMEVQEFADLVKNDVNQAVIALMTNISKQGGFEDMAKMFDEMGLDGTRALSVLTNIADKIQLVQARQKLANEAYEEGTSVINEFNVQNNTVQAGLDKAQKAFNEIVVELGEKLMPVARQGITTTSAMIKLLSQLVNFIYNNLDAVAALAVGIAAYNVALRAKIIAETTNLALEKAGWALHKARIITWGVLRGKIALATVAQRAWNVAIAANPAGAFAAAVAGVTYAMVKLVKSTTDSTKETRKLNTEINEINMRYNEQKAKIEELLPIAQDETASTDARRVAIEKLKEIYPDYFKDLDLETAKQYDLYKVLAAQNAERRKELALKQREAADEYEAYLAEYNKMREADSKMGSGTAMVAGASNGTRALSYAQEEAHLLDLKNAAEAATEALEEFDKTMQDNPELTIYNPNDTSADGTKLTTDKEKKAQEAAEKKAAAAEKKRLKAAVDSQKAIAAAEEAEVTRQYSQGEITYKEYTERKREIELNNLDKMIEIYGEDSNEAKKYMEKKEQLQLKYAEDQKLNEQQIISNSKQCAIELQMAYEDSNSDIYHNDRALQEALFENEQEALINRRDLYKQNSQEWLDLDAEITQRDEEHTLELRKQYADLLKKYREQWTKQGVAVEEEATIKGLEELHNRGLLSEEEYQKMLLEIRKKYAQISAEEAASNSYQATTTSNATSAYNTAKASAKAESGSSKVTLGSYFTSSITEYQSVNEKLKQMYEEDMITYDEYQQAKSLSFGTFAEDMVTTMQAAYESISSIMSSMSSYYSAQSSYEQAITEKKYDKLIEAAGNNTKKTEKLEEQKEEEIAAIKTKYNKKAMKIELAQATATMVLGAMNAYTSAWKGAPYPANLVLAPAAAAIATAAGLLNIASIKKQHEAEEAGYYSGGFTGGSNYTSTAGVVHEGEFVANHKAVNNSNILPALQLIDQAQRNNTVASLTADDISRSVGGGATVVSAPTVNVQTDNSEVAAMAREARTAIERLNTVLESPLQSYVTIDGTNGLDKQWKKWQRLQNNK